MPLPWTSRREGCRLTIEPPLARRKRVAEGGKGQKEATWSKAEFHTFSVDLWKR